MAKIKGLLVLTVVATMSLASQAFGQATRDCFDDASVVYDCSDAPTKTVTHNRICKNGCRPGYSNCSCIDNPTANVSQDVSPGTSTTTTIVTAGEVPAVTGCDRVTLISYQIIGRLIIATYRYTRYTWGPATTSTGPGHDCASVAW